MKRKLILFIVLIISIMHVHLNMFMTENFANPSFWVAFILESPPFGGMLWRVFSNILIMGIQCAVTSFIAFMFLRWTNVRRWLYLYCICIIAFILMWFLGDIPNNVSIDQSYEQIYGYGGAFKYCLTYSITQIIYIMSYALIDQSKK